MRGYRWEGDGGGGRVHGSGFGRGLHEIVRKEGQRFGDMVGGMKQVS